MLPDSYDRWRTATPLDDAPDLEDLRRRAWDDAVEDAVGDGASRADAEENADRYVEELSDEDLIDHYRPDPCRCSGDACYC